MEDRQHAGRKAAAEDEAWKAAADQVDRAAQRAASFVEGDSCVQDDP
jgi:hypothetical protein